jgi:hypothetical protein
MGIPEAFHAAVGDSQIEVAKYLLQTYDLNPRIQNNKLFKATSIHGDLDMLQLLIEKYELDPLMEDGLILKNIARHGHLECLQYFHSIRIDLSSYDNITIRTASARNHLKLVHYLLSILECKNEAIKAAFSGEHQDIVKQLFTQGENFTDFYETMKQTVTHGERWSKSITDIDLGDDFT